ncbi:gamma-glutamyl hydrolase [Chanos chanos]|uniref:folate gamma-glutamyl hydrolase n=1 Tax=Chanos chanos TaxID=29144 RepID=A0A6J2USL8_CHACN|nr:gamma-glutamyl hydrolase-like [Chanos chanos]
MKSGMLALNTLLFSCVITGVCSALLPTRLQADAQENNRPIIGILTQEISDDVMKKFGKTYIPASYVQYVESGGARVMPVKLNQSFAEHEKIFKSINGLLLIGGAVDLETSDFAHTAEIYFKLALKANDNGDYFPIWGTCLGLQLLTVLVAGENLLTRATAENVSLPLTFTEDPLLSRMFKSFPDKVLKALATEPLTGNFHHYGVTAEAFLNNQKLNDFFSILSTNIAENGSKFVSTMEGKKYPFYGVQWHPEVNRFQWDPNYQFPHSKNAVRVSSLLAEFFVNEARRSLHRFSQPEEEIKALIYNYSPVYVGNITAYELSYFF